LTVTIAAAQQGTSDQPAGTGPEGRGISVFNPIDSRIRVLSSRPDGARVEKGEVVCELDPADLQARVASPEITVQGLQAGAPGARLAREAAVMELNEYKDDRYAQDLAGVEGEIKLAESDLRRQEEKLDWARRIFDRASCRTPRRARRR